MYINITDTKEANNKGSSGGLVNYLEKENRVGNLSEPELWFNAQRHNLEAHEVRRSLDGNIAKLGKNEAKFFLINISPSQKELEHLDRLFGKAELKVELKRYTERVMDEYAKNFKRAGIDNNKDLLWYAKLENNRYYSYKDKEVKVGSKQRGERKPGNQMHIQVIVSRKDITNKIKLSPMNSSKGRNVEHSKKMGQFDRMAFKLCGEILFDRQFSFQRNLRDTLAYANIQKNGNLKQREQLAILEQGASQNYQSRSTANELAVSVSEGSFLSPSAMLETVGKTIGDFLETLIEPNYGSGIESDSMEEADKIRRKRLRQQNQGMAR